MSAADTKEQILDVAEQMIAQNGYAGTTLRSIVKNAKVNLAAVHYHFGSKEDLADALIARISGPVVAGHLRALEALSESEHAEEGKPISAEALLRAYLRPSFEFCLLPDASLWSGRARFIGRCRTEPDPVRTIADRQFGESSEKFLDALQQALPNQTRSQLEWKLDLVVSSLVRVLGEAGKPGALLAGHETKDIEFAVDKLVAFLLPGLESD